jgi:competence protein ComEC
MAAGPSSIGHTIGHSLDRPASAGLHTVPLFHAAWLFAAGILAANSLWLRPPLTLLALALTAALCLLAAFRAPRSAWLPLALLWLLLGAWCAEMEPHSAPAPVLTSFSDGLLRTVEGTVIAVNPIRADAEPAAATIPAQRIDLHLATIEEVNDAVDRQIPADGNLRLTVRWPTAPPQALPPLQCGERIRADVRLLPPETYHDPGAWSRAAYLLDQGITASATVRIDRIQRLVPAPGLFLRCRLVTWQHAATARLLALPAAMQRFPAPLRLSYEDVAMLAAMIAGDRTFLTHSMRIGFERTGSFHMLVVSGFHLAIVAGFIFWIARRLRLPRVPATVVTLAASFAYALFTGFATPVQRSLWMVTLYLLGRLVYRERSPLNVIGFAALCLLAASPQSLFDSSFQMTLLAVVAIAGIAAPLLGATIHPYAAVTRALSILSIDLTLDPPLAQFRVALRMIAQKLAPLAGAWTAWRLLPWLIRTAIRALELLAISCIIEVAMMLPMAVDFHRITLFALPVNLLILPLLLVMVPAALVALLFLVVWPAAAIVPALFVAVVLHIGVGLVHLFGSIALGDFRIANPLPWQWAAFYLLLGAAIALAHAGAFTVTRWPLRTAWIALVLAGAAAVAPRAIDRPRSALLVEAIDVGQGDSLLLITPDGKTLLVDAGGFSGGPRQAPQNFDIGEEVVSPALWARGIRHLDAVALTHAHSDHMGGMAAVLRNFHPAELWVGNNPPGASYNDLLAEAASLHIRVRSFRAGDGFAFGATSVEVLAPFRTYQPAAEPENNDSMVLHVAYGATSVLLEGDAEAPIEDAMLAQAMQPGHQLQSTLLKVGHHGSITSTQPAFLARVAPKWAVISCGPHNRYGHPRQEVLAALQQEHARTYRTDIDGASCFVLNGKTATADYQCGWRGLPQ